MGIIFAILLATFVGTFLYLILDYVGSKDRYESRKIKVRVESLFTASSSIERQINFSSIFGLNQALRRQALVKKIFNLLSLTGWNMPVSVFILSDLLWGGLVFIFTLYVTGSHLTAAAIAFLNMMLPYWFLIVNHQRYITKFVNAFPDALVLIKSALRAGQGIQASFQMVSKESPYPVNKEFAQVVREIELGSQVTDALNDLYRRIDTVDLRIFILGIFIQMEIGGNLVELIEHVERTIRERITMQREVRALSAQGRLTGTVLMLLPLGFALMMVVMNPNYFDSMTSTEIGKKVIVFALCMQAVGSLVIRKITYLKVA